MIYTSLHWQNIFSAHVCTLLCLYIPPFPPYLLFLMIQNHVEALANTSMYIHILLLIAKIIDSVC